MDPNDQNQPGPGDTPAGTGSMGNGDTTGVPSTPAEEPSVPAEDTGAEQSESPQPTPPPPTPSEEVGDQGPAEDSPSA